MVGSKRGPVCLSRFLLQRIRGRLVWGVLWVLDWAGLACGRCGELFINSTALGFFDCVGIGSLFDLIVYAMLCYAKLHRFF